MHLIPGQISQQKEKREEKQMKENNACCALLLSYKYTNLGNQCKHKWQWNSYKSKNHLYLDLPENVGGNSLELYAA